jgi:ABC-type nitrate/sulfonate/bicarbonate transport system substrate-binding protein
MIERRHAEKKPHPIRLGYVPLTDCAPIAVALETGIFDRHHLNVTTHREIGWATIRDRLFYNELDASQSIAGIALSLGFGFTDVRCEVSVPLVLNLHGNAITLSTSLPYPEIGNGNGLKKHLERHWKKDRPFTLASTHRFSSNGMLLHTWLKRCGLSDSNVEIIILPPPIMPAHLKSGHIDGFCVGEPYNSEAILGGFGWSPVTSAQLSHGHPEKVLLVSGEMMQERKNETIKLVTALIESCHLCEKPSFREDLIQILAMRKYTAAHPDILRNSLAGMFDTGVFKIPTEGFHMFFGDSVNRPTTDKASWTLAGLRSAGQLPESHCGSLSLLYREDIFMAAMNCASLT